MEILSCPVVVPLLHVTRFEARRVDRRNLLLEIEDLFRLRLRVSHACEGEHRRKVCLILRSDFRHPGGGVEVIVAIRHAEAALEQERRIPRGVVQVRGNPEAERLSV